MSFRTNEIRISCSIILHLGTPKESACVNGKELHVLPQAWRDIWCLKTTEMTDITSYIDGKSIHDYEGLRNGYSKKKQTPRYCLCYRCAYGSLVRTTSSHCGQRHCYQRDKSTINVILLLTKCLFTFEPTALHKFTNAPRAYLF